MSLKNILQDISTQYGIDITDDTERLLYIDRINQVCEELYNSMDIPGSIREQIFQVDDTNNYQVSFPHYVDKLRAIRFYNSHGGPITLEDMRPKYHQRRWGNNGKMRFRIKQENACLARNITNAAMLKFKLPTGKTETTDIRIRVIGRTANSQQLEELVVLPAGQNEVSTLNGYEEVFNIEKENYNTYDITILDVDDTVMASIPNNLLRPNYTIVMIRPDDWSLFFNNSYPLNTIEVLYKTRFYPLRNLRDEFPCPNCDKLIFWKFAEHYEASKPGNEQRAIMASQKSKEILYQLNSGDEAGKELTVDFGSNNLFDAQRDPTVNELYAANSFPLIQYTP